MNFDSISDLQVISTRILRDSAGISKGVGFARMEIRILCLLNLPMEETKKKNMYKNNESAKIWRESAEGITAVAYDPSSLAPNGVVGQHMMPTALSTYRHYANHQFPFSTGTPWMQQYVMAPPIQQIDDSYNLSGHMAAQYKNDGQAPRGIPLMMPSTEATVQYTNMIPQIATQMGAMQISTGSYISPQYPYYHPSIIHAVPVDSEHTSNAASPEDPYNYQATPK
ncbi:hypothetical protein NQ314_009005 [Rhamnusium bicolor]|uniref:Uncharacterized protein n=1 Tax=Rhamnusium bicolor TaxID=1586634 RepID=A0AAV8Y4U8_9CUCU|nr:hypothetical protein NQ314_009005 [Rhamnusium bicolor]